MTINQTVSEQMREFDSYRNYDGSEYGSYLHASIRGFIHSYTRKLIESVAEEIIGEERPLPTYRFEKDAPYDVHTAVDLFIEAERETSRELLKDEQRLKLKEIISQISK